MIEALVAVLAKDSDRRCALRDEELLSVPSIYSARDSRSVVNKYV